MAKQGRPKGSVSGPRPTIYIANGIVDGVSKGIRFEKKVSNEEEFTDSEVRQMFVDKYGSNPTEVHGPFHDKKGGVKTVTQIKQNADAVAVVTDDEKAAESNDMEMSEVIGEASFQEWKGTAYKIEGKDNQVVFIASEHESDSSKMVPAMRKVNKADLTFPQALAN